MTRRPGVSGGRRKPRAASIHLTHEEVEEIATEAAERAVTRLLLTLGIDATSPDGILSAQRDFQHVHAWRKSVDTVKRQGIISAVGVIVLGVLALIWQRMGGGSSPP